MILKTLGILIVFILVVCPASTKADLIDFEDGFSDGDSVNTVITPTNMVTFSVDGGDSVYIVQVGTPQTAFASNDKPASGIGGKFFITDEPFGPKVMKSFIIHFDSPVSNLSLNLYDYRDDKVKPGDTATLSVFSDSDMTTLVGRNIHSVPSGAPDGYAAILSVSSYSALIQSARLNFSKRDIGVGIDNIAFTTASMVENCPDTLLPSGSIHAYDNAIWSPNNKMVTVSLQGRVADESGISSAYILVGGDNEITLTDLDENGNFFVDIEMECFADPREGSFYKNPDGSFLCRTTTPGGYSLSGAASGSNYPNEDISRRW